MTENTEALEPIQDQERYTNLDIIRGVALFGVMWINLLTEFRVSLFKHLFVFHTHPGWINEWIDLVSAWLIEYKAFIVFSFLFGVGIAVQTERNDAREVRSRFFMLRRFGILLGIGLFHMFFIWSGDILCLYAISGVLVVGMRRLPIRFLIAASVTVFSLRFTGVFGEYIPGEKAMLIQAAQSTAVYAHGTFSQILVLRRHEAFHFTMPLLFGVLPQTLSLMLLGIATWRSGILKRPECRRRLFGVLFGAGTAIGAICTSLIFWSASSGKPLPLRSEIVDAFSALPLALGLTAGLTLWISHCKKSRFGGLIAAAGQMALTNYLMQSIVFSLIFYKLGLGLIGQLSPSSAAMIGVVFFGLQITASRVWLRKHRFGPAEWLWRTLTYGRWQPMRR